MTQLATFYTALNNCSVFETRNYFFITVNDNIWVEWIVDPCPLVSRVRLNQPAQSPDHRNSVATPTY